MNTDNCKSDIKRMQVIECLLPGEAILYLFERADCLQIELLAEKRNSEDYAVIQIEGDNKRVYIFQLLVEALRRYFKSELVYIFRKEELAQQINDLFAKLKV